MKTKNYLVYAVQWLESEQGWGTRPDGESIHYTLEDYNQFMKAYWAKMLDVVPIEYSRPCSVPVLGERQLTNSEYKKMLKEKGLRRF